jgi:hypothetical protein
MTDQADAFRLDLDLLLLQAATTYFVFVAAGIIWNHLKHAITKWM